MASLIAIPFLIGSVPIGLAVVGANHFLKDKRKTNKFLYWGGITASAFGGWVVSNMLMTRYVESEVLSAENSDKYKLLPTRLIIAIDTSASTVMDYKGRFGKKFREAMPGREYPLAKKYETMAKNMVKILQPDDIVFLDWNGQGVRYYDETTQSYNGTGSYKSIAEFIKEKGLDRGDFLTTTVTITDAPMPSFHEFKAESKFKEPYMKGDKIDMKRGNDGRFRRRLVVPLKKNADTFTPQYFYRWVGQLPHHGNPIMYGNPDAFELGGNRFNEAVLIHYVSPLYDEEYVKTLVHNLNKISNK